MKNIFKTVLALAVSLPAWGIDTGINPLYLDIKVYKVAVSESEFCTDLKVIFEDAAPIYQDFLTSPVLGNGKVKNGTYKCIAIEMSDVIKSAPDQNSDSGNCVLGQEEVGEICHANNGGLDSGSLIDGTPVNCVDGEQRVAIYLSTVSLVDNNQGTAFKAPLVSNLFNGLPLSAPLKVQGHTKAKMIVNGAGSISDEWGKCEIGPPQFGFANIK